MYQHDGAKISRGPTIDLLARAIERHIDSAGDHVTALPALSLHRRDAPTEPVHCIYDFGLAVTAQGAKQVMLGDNVLNYGPGESMLTPIDLPIANTIACSALRLNAMSGACGRTKNIRNSHPPIRVRPKTFPAL